MHEELQLEIKHLKEANRLFTEKVEVAYLKLRDIIDDFKVEGESHDES